jgi:RNA polymerase sigma factor (sigma-70 family)
VPTGQINRVLQHLQRALLTQNGESLSDGQLVEGFIRRREEAALEILIRRHGPMVLAVCRRILGNHHDAEDAFQATFLVLVRKASSINPREMVGNWLYGVACNTALKARALAARRKSREKQVMHMPEPEGAANRSDNDLAALLDQELKLLPDKYRSVIVLCDLEGKTRKEVASQLGWPEGTVAGRLARARTLLARRLEKHGLALAAAAMPAALAESAALAAVPTSLTQSTLQAALLFSAGKAAAAGAISLKVLTLTEGVLKTMLVTKLKIATAIVVAAGIIALQTGILSYRTSAAEPGAKSVDRATPASNSQPEKQMRVGSLMFRILAAEGRNGETDTEQHVIVDQLKFSPGELVSRSDLLEAERRLANLGIFEVDPAKGIKPSVEFDPADDGSPFADILVTVKEKPADPNKSPTPAERQAEKNLQVADYYNRTGHAASACFYYELIMRRYPKTKAAEAARIRLDVLMQAEIASITYRLQHSGKR